MRVILIDLWVTNQVPTPKTTQCFAPLFLPHCAMSSHALEIHVVMCVLGAVCFLSLFALFEIEIILASRWLWETTLWLFSEVLVITIIYSQFWNILGRHHLHPDSFSWIFITSWASVPKLCFPKFFFFSFYQICELDRCFSTLFSALCLWQVLSVCI